MVSNRRFRSRTISLVMLYTGLVVALLPMLLGFGFSPDDLLWTISSLLSGALVTGALVLIFIDYMIVRIERLINQQKDLQSLGIEEIRFLKASDRDLNKQYLLLEQSIFLFTNGYYIDRTTLELIEAISEQNSIKRVRILIGGFEEQARKRMLDISRSSIESTFFIELLKNIRNENNHIEVRLSNKPINNTVIITENRVFLLSNLSPNKPEHPLLIWVNIHSELGQQHITYFNQVWNGSNIWEVDEDNQ
jgi:hypothetical protein